MDMKALQKIDKLFDEIATSLHLATVDFPYFSIFFLGHCGGMCDSNSQDKNHNGRLSWEEIEGVMLD